MIRRPRKIRFQRLFKFKHDKRWLIGQPCQWEGSLQCVTTIKLSWHMFELLRLRLAWSLTKKKRSSRKYQFKQKLASKKSKQLFFHRQFQTKKYIFWYHGFPHLNYSTKVRGSRMGKGKGNSKNWYHLVRGGTIFLRLRHNNFFKLRYILNQLVRALPGTIRYNIIVLRNEMISF